MGADLNASRGKCLMNPTTFRISDRVKKKLDKYMKLSGENRSQVVRAALEWHFEKKEIAKLIRRKRKKS